MKKRVDKVRENSKILITNTSYHETYNSKNSWLINTTRKGKTHVMVCDSGIEIPLADYRFIKRKIYNEKLCISVEDYYAAKRAKELLNG